MLAAVVLAGGLLTLALIGQFVQGRREQREQRAYLLVDSLRRDSILANPARADSVRRHCTALIADSVREMSKVEAFLWDVDRDECRKWLKDLGG